MADLTQTKLFGVPVAPTNGLSVEPDRYVERDAKHTGVAGVARDVLGTLGDFLLTKLGVGPMYAPAQQRRRLAAAQEGFDSDPVSAIQRVTSIDPVFGAKLRDQYTDNARLAATQASTEESRVARIAQQQAATDLRTRGYAASMLGSMASWDDPKRTEFYPKMREQVLAAAQRQGLDLSAELPATYDPTTLDAFIDASVPVGTQRSQRLTREKMEVQEKQFDRRQTETERRNSVTESQTNRRLDQADTRNAISATRARTGGSGRKQTEAQIVQDLIDSGKPLTAGQQARVRKYTQGTRAEKPRPSAADLGTLRKYPQLRDAFDAKFGVGMAKRVLGE